MKKSIVLLLFILIIIFGCKPENNRTKTKILDNIAKIKQERYVDFNSKTKTIHILVALCDNKYQGIVPVPKNLGNGQNPKSNLYWGAAYGIKTFFKRSKEWKLLETKKVNNTILERLVFKHKTKDFYIVADAYNGKNIKQTVVDYLKSVSGIMKDTIKINKKTIGINGNASLLAYIGHDGLMDFELNETFKNNDGKKRDAILLACYSKNYFSNYIIEAKANPIVWTTGLMAPEAYTIHDAINAYINNESDESDEQIRLKAAKAYSKYQKCSLKAANNLLVKGF